jgi:hypothetical protein
LLLRRSWCFNKRREYQFRGGSLSHLAYPTLVERDGFSHEITWMSYRLQSTNVIPPGGWEYREPRIDGPPFKAGDYAGLVQKVMTCRRRNNFERPGKEEVEADIQQQICQRVGHEWCDHMKAGQWGFSISFDRIKTGTVALLGWATAALKGQDPYVDDATANRRAEACAKCWANKATGGCISCGLGDQIREMLVEAKGDRWTAFDQQLESCIVCGCANQAQVHIKGEILRAGITDHQRECYAEIPGCWKAEL